jgi:hypothetical protein
MIARYSAFYDDGSPECREQIHHLVNAEFQRRMIARSELGHFQESVLHAIDHLWGSQRMPDDPSVNHDLLTRLIGIAVMRDLRQDETFLKMSRYEGEKLRSYNRALNALKRNLRDNNTDPTQSQPTDSYRQLHLTAGLIPAPTAEVDPQDPVRRQLPRARSVSEGMAEGDQPPTDPNAGSNTTGEPSADIPAVGQPASHPIAVASDHAADIPLAETIQNPIPDFSQTIQPDTLCKSDPEITSCPLCRHPHREQLRYLLGRTHDIHSISSEWDIPILDLWRCRLHHIEDPTDFYNPLGAVLRKSRLLDATDLKPTVYIEDENHPLGVNIPFPEYKNAA